MSISKKKKIVLFACHWTVYQWNRTLRSLLCLLFFAQHYFCGIHPHSCMKLPFIHFLCCIVFHCTNNMFVYSTVFGYLGCFQVWAITLHAEMSTHSFLIRKIVTKNNSARFEQARSWTLPCGELMSSCFPSQSPQKPLASSWEDPRP